MTTDRVSQPGSRDEPTLEGVRAACARAREAVGSAAAAGPPVAQARAALPAEEAFVGVLGTRGAGPSKPPPWLGLHEQLGRIYARVAGARGARSARASCA